MEKFAKRIIPCLDVKNGRVVKGVNFVNLIDTGDPVEIAKKLFIPLTVGGGIKNEEDINRLLSVGCDKISINSAAIANPNLIDLGANKFGSQCIVVAIDAKKVGENYHVFINGGRVDTKIDALKWAKEVFERGAGEILLTSMDQDGMKNGYELTLTREVSQRIDIPVIASGGAGKRCGCSFSSIDISFWRD